MGKNNMQGASINIWRKGASDVTQHAFIIIPCNRPWSKCVRGQVVCSHKEGKSHMGMIHYKLKKEAWKHMIIDKRYQLQGN
jgi:hypothetical protein